MTPQTAAEGILKRNDWGDSKIYQVVCDCSDANHDHNIWVEAEDCGVTVTIYTTSKSKWFEMSRWRKIWILLTQGYIEEETSIIMKEQQALNYAETLKNAVEDVKNFKKSRETQLSKDGVS